MLDLTSAEYQILRAVAQLRDNPKSLDSVLAQLEAFMKQKETKEQITLKQELDIVLGELRHLGLMMGTASYEAKNQHIAICQHVERIRRELK